MERKLIENGCLKKEREAFLQHLIELGYCKTYVYNHELAIRRMERFIFEHNQNKYSETVAETFLTAASEMNLYSQNSLKNMECVLRRFAAFINDEDFVLHPKSVSRECPEQFVETFINYLEHLRSRSFREKTIEYHRYSLLRILKILDAAGIKSITFIAPENIYEAFEKSSDKTSFSFKMRGFLRYLYENKILKADYSIFVPSVRKARPVPSVYTKSETEKLLNSIDTNTNYGMRNYAIILLALRLGMRSCDIANLKITDVDFKNKEICFFQVKTQIPQRLELLPKIEDALLSYISTARSISDIPNVFLSINPPIRPITANVILTSTSYHLKKSGIDIGERKQGAHSLRMTLASELTAEKVPYDVIRKILGHEDPISIKYYVKFDIESLRSCAIEVPPVTGKLASYMKVRSGGKHNEVCL